MTRPPVISRIARSFRRPIVLGSCAALAVLSIALAGPASAVSPPLAGGWQPEPAIYGYSPAVTTSVTMDDGVALSVQTIYPTIPSTGARAPGSFPVLLTLNPYGAGVPNAADFFVQRGYIYVFAAVRGTGASGGQLDWFGQRQGQDGAALVNWVAHSLSGSDGVVGLDGCSYLGMDQWFTAAAVGKNSPLKAITPFCTGSNFYGDTTALGGIPTPVVAQIATGEPRGPQDNRIPIPSRSPSPRRRTAARVHTTTTTGRRLIFKA